MKNTKLSIEFIGPFVAKVQANNGKFEKKEVIEIPEDLRAREDGSTIGVEEAYILVEYLYNKIKGLPTDHVFEEEPKTLRVIEEKKEEDEEEIEIQNYSRLSFFMENIKSLNFNNLLRIIAISGIIIGAIYLSGVNFSANINQKNISNLPSINKLDLVKESKNGITELRTKELSVQKDLRNQREKEHKEWEAKELYYNNLIDQSKDRVSKLDEEFAFLSTQEIKISKEVDVLDLTGFEQKTTLTFKALK